MYLVCLNYQCDLPLILTYSVFPHYVVYLHELYTHITLFYEIQDLSQLETETEMVCWKQVFSFHVLKYHILQVKSVFTRERYTVFRLDFVSSHC